MKSSAKFGDKDAQDKANRAEWFVKGDSLQKSGKYKEAIDIYSKAIELAPNSLESGQFYYNRAIIYNELGNTEQGINDYKMAAKLGIKQAQDLFSSFEWAKKGFALQESEKYNESIDAYSKAIELSPNWSSGYLSRGIVYAKLGSKEQSMNDFRTAAKLGNKDAQDYLNKVEKKNRNTVRLSCSIPELIDREFTVDYEAKTVNGNKANITDDSIYLDGDDFRVTISRYTGKMTVETLSTGYSKTGQCIKVSEKQF